MLEIIIILIVTSLFIVGGTVFFIAKYYWGPGRRSDKSKGAREVRNVRSDDK